MTDARRMHGVTHIWARSGLPQLMSVVTALSVTLGLIVRPAADARAAEADRPVLRVKATEDFEVTGSGQAAAWQTTEWTSLAKRPNSSHDYTTRVKVLYSAKGFYVLMDATDETLTATMQDDFENLWTEDVFEFFVWTDERYPVYFEYEISPLGRELPILIPNFDGQFFGWRPWHYEGPRKTKRAVAIVGGPQRSGARVRGWQAEIFTPYELLHPLKNVPPTSGTRWRANFYRMDYDRGATSSWDWARVGDSFHDYQNFGVLQFE